MAALWRFDSTDRWMTALDSYEAVVERQGVDRLFDLDRWYRVEFARLIAERAPPYITSAELVRLTEWKMARGVWRARNLVLVRGNAPEEVGRTSSLALAEIPHFRRPVAILATLAGVGPATASAIAAAAAPAIYPFFDELVAEQVPDLGSVSFTMTYYLRYAERLRERARRLGDPWTPVTVERALWAHSGGKAGRGAQGDKGDGSGRGKR
jgi:hypothetical protein